MKDDTELDDRILGTALARAIESQPVRETPFASSRAAARASSRPRSFALPAVATAAALVLAVAFGATLLGQRRDEATPAATQPPAAPTPVATPQLATAVPVAVTPVPIRVYFARDGLPPVSATVLGSASTPSTDTAGDHIRNRIGALWDAQARDIPAGARNAVVSAPSTGQRSLSQSVKVDGSVASVDLAFDPPLAIRSAADTKAIVQQLVYTATEEPGIDRVVLLSGGKPMVLGSFPVDTKPLSRADVAGYSVSGLTGTFTFDGTSAASQLSTSYAVDAVAPGLARFTIAVAGLPAHAAPSFTITAYDQTHMAGANAELEILIPNGSDTTTAAAQVDRSPLRSIAIGSPVTFPAKVYRLGLDRLWPWRAVVLFDPTRIVIDIGGPPTGISADQNEAVYSPVANGEVGRSFTLSGAARAFEATIAYRVRDDRQNVVLTGSAHASIGTSAVWGGYETTVTLPSSVSGNVTLEVFEMSMKDGTEMSKVSIPIRVR